MMNFVPPRLTLVMTENEKLEHLGTVAADLSWILLSVVTFVIL